MHRNSTSKTGSHRAPCRSNVIASVASGRQWVPSSTAAGLRAVSSSRDESLRPIPSRIELSQHDDTTTGPSRPDPDENISDLLFPSSRATSSSDRFHAGGSSTGRGRGRGGRGGGRGRRSTSSVDTPPSATGVSLSDEVHQGGPQGRRGGRGGKKSFNVTLDEQHPMWAPALTGSVKCERGGSSHSMHERDISPYSDSDNE